MSSPKPSSEGLLHLVYSQIQQLMQRVEVIDDRTRFLPKLYDNVDKIMGEILENRQERVFMGHTLHDHEERLTNIEDRWK
ncbi:MAG: hypothetical protein WC243_03390 [Patescibacteria group bacterium]